MSDLCASCHMADGVMPGFAGQLTDDEVALIVNHVRNSWGNDAPTVTPDEVTRTRSAEQGPD